MTATSMPRSVCVGKSRRDPGYSCPPARCTDVVDDCGVSYDELTRLFGGC
jgi:hypothetical protein